MNFLRKRMYQRFPKIGLLADLALLGTAASKLAQRKGFGGTGANSLGVSQSMSPIEMALAAGAAWRILSRVLRRK